MKAYRIVSIFSLFALLLYACDSKPKKPRIKEPLRANSGKVFNLLPPDSTRVYFNNEFEETETINFYSWQYLYNGGGVGIGDINNDGLPDLYFTGTATDDKLYLNLGNMKFQDISHSAGIQSRNGLKTGVSMVDINADGFLDIYVCRSGWFSPKNRANLLYLNQGNNTFVEMAQQFGLAETGNSVQAGFFDYDRDGDLDVYITNHPLFKQTIDEMVAEMKNPPDRFRDKLYRNNGNNSFTEVARNAGINNSAHGLGLAITDFNNDGWPDVYVANDYEAKDYYYVNNGNGTFSEKINSLTAHISFNAMGSDAADINNDGMPDLFVAEMLAEDNKRQKTNMASMNPGLFWGMVTNDQHYQYMRNTLQLNNGDGSFSDIAYLSGLAETDWSWAPLFADFDHDGKKDLAVSNGFLKDMQDKDLMNNVKKNKALLHTYDDLLALTKSTRIKNYVFKNRGNFRFSNKSQEWGFDFAGYSNGMAYGDLDNDGDLDLVVNNMNDYASVYRNTISDRNLGHFLLIELEGPSQNPKAYGTKLRLKTEKEEQYQEFWVVRGFESSCDQRVHFGIEEGDYIVELKVDWPDGKTQIIRDLEYDQRIKLKYEKADFSAKEKKNLSTIFTALGSESLFQHQENSYDDYEKQVLLPHRQSMNGPKITVGDVNADGLDDFYVGGAAGQAGRLLIQVEGKRFRISSNDEFQKDAEHEDIGGTFFDADGDGDLDLYIASGGNEFEDGSALLQDRIYLNDGSGSFQKKEGILPKMNVSSGVVVAADIDADGDQDLFVGGRLIAGKYPYAPRSYVLRNEGGKFIDATKDIAPELLNPGMITSAVWSDFSGDGNKDLVVVGEWTGILMFQNENGMLKNMSAENGMQQETGWWNKVLAVDIDQDGDQDYVLGNLGLNYKYQASKKEPFEVYAGDFDENGSYDIVLGYYNDGTCYPVRGRQCSAEQMPMILDKFETYEKFGKSDIKEVYGDKLEEGLHLKAHNFASSIVLNEGGGKFKIKPLPIRAQFSSVHGIVAEDFDRNGTIDLLLAGNLFHAEVETGRADAGQGLLLMKDSLGNFNAVLKEKSGFQAALDVKDLKLLQTGNNQAKIILVANNNDGMQAFIENIK